MTEYNIYDLDFQDVYDISFEDVDPTPFETSDAKPVAPDVTSGITENTLPETSDAELQQNNHGSEPEKQRWRTVELKQRKDYLLETILSHDRDEIHIGNLIRSHFGVRRLDDDTYHNLLSDLDGLVADGHISRMGDTPYYWREAEQSGPVMVPEVLSEVERQRRTAEFIRDLVAHAQKLEQDGRVKATLLVRDYERSLRIDNGAARQLLCNLEATSILFYAGVHKGSKQLTTSPELAIDKAVRLRKKRIAREKTQVTLGIEDRETITAVLDTLAALAHVEQSMPIKKIWSDGYLGQLIDEKDFRRVIRLLTAKGIVSTEKQHGQFRAGFATQAMRRQWKEDKDMVMTEVYGQAGTEPSLE